jgi:preprotein translocase subunit SecA
MKKAPVKKGTQKKVVAEEKSLTLTGEGSKLATFFKRALGDNQKGHIKRYYKKIAEINKLEDTYKEKSDKELRAMTDELRNRLEKKSLDAILPDAFALVRETSRRVLGQRHFDVQLIGGMVLHEGKVAEMKTGEGKTLVATTPLYLNALTGKGAHLITVNEYLAQLHAGWMGQLYHALGLTTGVIIPDASFIYDETFNNEEHDDPRFRHLRPCTRQEAYRADITYGTNNEFGFDYLRDNMVREESQLRQRELHYAIVDEVDSILIDEARTPLIISAPSSASASSYEQFARIAKQLKPEHYEKDEKRKAVHLTDAGVEKVEKILGISNLYGPDNVRLIYHLDQALRAQTLFTRDKDYVVASDGEVIIVDEFTGRLLKGRRYNEGLHQAIEAKEGVEVQEESMTLATISFQNLFRLYDKLAGMTGTAATESEEFHQIYKLDVVEIPTNKKVIRRDLADKIYRTEAGKLRAITQLVAELNKKGQPVLVGTSSIEKNEVLAAHFKKAGIPHQVLNAKNNEREAKIVMGAGQKGAVTIATNIAGRGTDIMLTDETRELGGLYVIGSERNESRRVDNQFRGRSGRQGDPGTTQFYVSCEDDLMRIFAGDRIAKIMDRLKVDEDTPLENRFVSKSLEGAQKKVEGFNYDSRKNVVQYDDVMNRHRRAVYLMRKNLLQDKDVSAKIREFIADEARELALLPGTDAEYEKLITDVFPFDDATLDRLFDAEADRFEKVLAQEAIELYENKEVAFTPEVMREVERDIYFQVLDDLWMRHLENMDHLREGIHWYSVGQKDPLVEYRRQAQLLFEAMQANLCHDTLRALFHAAPIDNDDLLAPVETELTRAARASVDNADKIVEGEVIHEEDFKAKKPASKPKGKTSIKKARKNERKRRAKGKKRK